MMSPLAFDMRFSFWITLAVVGCGQAAPQRADVILHNGHIYSMAWPEPSADGRPHGSAPWDSTTGWRHDASAVAMRDGVIIYVGSDEGALALRGDSTIVRDLDGATVLPGLVDAHTHVAELGQTMDRVDLTKARDEAEAVALVEARAATTPKGDWILGWGWDEGAWANRYPDKRLLSARVPEHPVVLRGLHGFAAWTNEAALGSLGLGPSTAVPVGGEIRRGRDGALSGLFLNRAVEVLDGLIPQPSPSQRDSQVVRGLRAMAQSGFTMVHEAGVPRDVVASLLRLDSANALPIRIYAMLNGRDSALLAEWTARGPLRRSTSGMLSIRAVKAYYDGALGSRGARLLEDYSDRPGHRGVSGGGYGFNRATVARTMAAGFQVGIHAIGDEGNRATLDFIDSVMTATPTAKGLRHRVEHAQVVSLSDIPRFGTSEIIASVQPPHAVEDMPWAEVRVGSARIRGAYAWRSLRQAGARLVFSSDLPGSDWNPFYGLHSAIARQDRKGNPAGGWYPEQRMSVEEAVRGYSTWAAYAGFDEDSTGVIAPGRRADLTVISVDPFRVASPSELLGGSVRATVVRGRLVFVAP